MPVSYRYDIPDPVRTRLLHTIRSCVEQGSGNETMEGMLDEMHEIILHRQGALRRPAPDAPKRSSNVVVEHFFRCSDDEALEFLTLCFATRSRCGGQLAVEAINHVFDEEHIGFALAPYSAEPMDEADSNGDEASDIKRFLPTAKTARVHLPSVVRKYEPATRSAAAEPCLEALSDAGFAISKDELLSALDAHRQGNFGQAMGHAGASFNSVLQTICAQKHWPCHPGKDTYSKLLDVCRDHGLFPGYYRPLLEAPLFIGGRLGETSGSRPVPSHPATQELAAHLLDVVCNNIHLLVSLAKL